MKIEILPKIILISGKAGAGKDFLAVNLAHHMSKYGSDVLIDRFAKFLKDATSTLAEVVRPHLKNPSDFMDDKIFGSQKTELSRKFMQVIGTEVLRTINPDIHAEMLFTRINKFVQGSHLRKCVTIIPDLRYDNEFHFFQNRGTQLNGVFHIHVVDPNDMTTDTHSSENGLTLKPIYTLVNDKTKTGEELVEEIVRECPFIFE